MKRAEFLTRFEELLREYAETDKYDQRYRTIADVNVESLLEDISIETNIPISDLINKLIDTVTRKNADYSKEDDALSNFYEVEKWLDISAEDGIYVRCLDKVSRYRNLKFGNKEPQVMDEKIEDTLLDLIAYIVIMNILIEDKKTKETK